MLIPFHATDNATNRRGIPAVERKPVESQGKTGCKVIPIPTIPVVREQIIYRLMQGQTERYVATKLRLPRESVEVVLIDTVIKQRKKIHDLETKLVQACMGSQGERRAA